MNTVGLDVDTIRDEFSLLLKIDIFFSKMFSESPLLGSDNSLLSGEFVLSSSQGFHGTGDVILGGSDGVKGLSDFDSGALFNGLTEGSSNTSLESIGSGTGQHFVHSDNVPGVYSASHVETFLSGGFGHVLVGGNTGSFQGAGRNLFFLPGDHMDGVGELIA